MTTDAVLPAARAPAPAGPPVVIVLASGRGTRFAASGGTLHKLQAPLAGRTVLQRTCDAVREAGLPLHLEDRGWPGMGDSIAAAVRATADACGWLVLPGDLPLVRPATLRAVADLVRLGRVALPLHAGQRGHPVGFPAACRQALVELHGDHGAAPVVRQWKARGCATELPVDDAGILLDVDTVADLRAAEAFLSAAARA